MCFDGYKYCMMLLCRFGTEFWAQGRFAGFSCLDFWDFWVSAILIAIRLNVDRDQDEQIPDLEEG